jgi:hypothetical protein
MYIYICMSVVISTLILMFFQHIHVMYTCSSNAIQTGVAAPLAALSFPLAQSRAALGESALGSLGGGITPTIRGDLSSGASAESVPANGLRYNILTYECLYIYTKYNNFTRFYKVYIYCIYCIYDIDIYYIY